MGLAFLISMLSCFYASDEEPMLDIPPPWIRVAFPYVEKVAALGKPSQPHTWDKIPSVRVCTDSGVSVNRATRAMKYWELHGYAFAGVVGDPFSMCMTPKHGEIIITLPEVGFAGNHLASTKLYTDNKTGYIVKAKIHILPKYARKERVLEHEIGHALGWEHYRQRYHIMYPTWSGGGYDSYGIRKR
jgi:hypothetical protein